MSIWAALETLLLLHGARLGWYCFWINGVHSRSTPGVAVLYLHARSRWEMGGRLFALFARFERIWVCEHISAYIIVVMRNAQVLTQRPNVFEMKN